jgi:predicted SAM-dependent methyltransferase
MKLDIACGGNKQEGFTGIDIRKLKGVDIVHDLEKFPWPLKKESVTIAIASHYIEHIKPWLSIDFMNEVWRVMVPGGTFCASTPYPGSRGFWQDPTHQNGWSEVTFQYFDPKYPLYQIYQPKPWKIHEGFPTWQVVGNLEVIMEKVLVVKGEVK